MGDIESSCGFKRYFVARQLAAGGKDTGNGMNFQMSVASQAGGLETVVVLTRGQRPISQFPEIIITTRGGDREISIIPSGSYELRKKGGFDRFDSPDEVSHIFELVGKAAQKAKAQ